MAKDNTPVQKIAELESQIEQVTAERDKAQTDLTAMTKLRDSHQRDSTVANDTLAEEQKAHTATGEKLKKAEADLAKGQKDFTDLKTNFEKEVMEKANLKAAEIAAGQGIPPVNTATADKHSDTDPDPAQKNLTAIQRLSAGAKRDLQALKE